MPEPIKVTVSDPDTGEVLGEQVIDNDYMVICAGSAYLANTQAHTNGTHVLTVKGRESGRAETPEDPDHNGSQGANQ